LLIRSLWRKALLLQPISIEQWGRAGPVPEHFREPSATFTTSGYVLFKSGQKMIQHSSLSVHDGIQFRRSADTFRQITDIPEYHFGDIRPDDIVVDVGANVGAFCLRAARTARRVTAVEPVACSPLRENIRLNGAEVNVIEGALGDGKQKEICWDDCRVISPTYTLRAIREIAGGCDFLKCDCEGAEWLINSGDLAGIRRIEMELHIPPISGPPKMELLDWIGRYYDFAIDRKPCHDILGVMGVLHAELK
jgi:hypothetical protein